MFHVDGFYPFCSHTTMKNIALGSYYALFGIKVLRKSAKLSVAVWHGTQELVHVFIGTALQSCVDTCVYVQLRVPKEQCHDKMTLRITNETALEMHTGFEIVQGALIPCGLENVWKRMVGIQTSVNMGKYNVLHVAKVEKK